MNVATAPFTDQEPAIPKALADRSRTRMLFTEAGLITRWKVTTICWLLLLMVVPLTGVAVAPNAPVTAVAELPVVKLLVNGVTAFPSGSLNPPTVTV